MDRNRWRLVDVSDIDAWADPKDIERELRTNGTHVVFCVHPQIALVARENGYSVLLSKNSGRPDEDYTFDGFIEWKAGS
jgi:hypothetical protein